MTNKPLLLLDIDGVLNPYMASNSKLPDGYWKAKMASSWAQARVRLNRRHGPMLTAFAEQHGMELAWATMWGPWAANRFVGSEIGLPELPGVDLATEDRETHRRLGQAWKFGFVLEYAVGRDLAWLDDEFQIEHVFRDEFLRVRSERTLLVDVAPAVGLTSEHLAAVAAWVKEN